MLMGRRLYAGAAAVALALIGAAGCGGDPPDGPASRVKIGLLVSLSGTYQSVGTDMRDGFQCSTDRPC
jgi:branched-chain amino acid transport system substrate-binding protein